jgi:hypothetical protein
MARGAVVGLAAVAAGGCGGGAERHFTAADAVRIANVAPGAPGWTWPRDRRKPAWTPGSAGSGPTDPVVTSFRKATAGLVGVGDAEKEWQDSNKLAHLDVGVYGSATDAHKAMAPFDTLSHKLGARTGTVTSAGAVHGIGSDAWRLRVSGNGPQVTYHWRRGNLVIEAHIHCFGRCPADVDAATRAWVGRVDTAARARS